MKNQPIIYFDNASTVFPKPKIILDYMAEYLSHIGGSPARGGHKLADLADNYITNVRKNLASLFNITDHSHVVFTQNATHSLNIVIKGYLKSGDHALICNFSHNSVLRPLNSLKQKNIVTYDIFQISSDGLVDEEEISKLIKTNTRIIICNHASNVIGVKAPLKQISKIAKKYGLHFLVDCSQSAIYLNIDVEHDSIDFLVGTGHKTLNGPPGIGFLYIKDGNLVDCFMEGGSGGNHSISPMHPKLLPHKFEAGTMNFLGIAGLAGGLDYLKQVGINYIILKTKELTMYALNKLLEIKECIIYGSKDLSLKIPIISFNILGWRLIEIAEILDKNYSIMLRPGIQCAPLTHHLLGTLPNGTVRISFNHMNCRSQDLILQTL